MFHILSQACLTEKQFKFGFNRETIVFVLCLTLESFDRNCLTPSSFDWQFFQATKMWNIWSGSYHLIWAELLKISKTYWWQGFIFPVSPFEELFLPDLAFHTILEPGNVDWHFHSPKSSSFGRFWGFKFLKCSAGFLFPDILWARIWIYYRILSMGGLESVRIQFLLIFGRNWKVSELESVRIGKCQNWKVSE